MKKVFYFLTLGLALGFSSCSSDEDSVSNEGVNAAAKTASTAKKAVTDPAVGITTTLNLTSALLANGTAFVLAAQSTFVKDPSNYILQ